MSQWAAALRLSMPCDKEWKTTELTVTDVAVEFGSSLTGGNARKRISVYNNSNSGSGECYYGPDANVSDTDRILPKGDDIDLPLASGENIGLFFIADNQANLRIFECS